MRLIGFGSLATGSLLTLVALRILAPHKIDSLLVRPLVGPVRLNYLLDMGLSLAVATCGWRYLVLTRQAPVPRPAASQAE